MFIYKYRACGSCSEQAVCAVAAHASSFRQDVYSLPDRFSDGASSVRAASSASQGASAVSDFEVGARQ
jgi:hypothetical protein